MLSFPFTSELKGFGIEINMHIVLVPKGSTIRNLPLTSHKEKEYSGQGHVLRLRASIPVRGW